VLDVYYLAAAPDPVLIASEGALWGAIRHQGRLLDTVIVSDDAGQFRVGRLLLDIPRSSKINHLDVRSSCKCASLAAGFVD
jgi:hypothetical protein